MNRSTRHGHGESPTGRATPLPPRMRRSAADRTCKGALIALALALVAGGCGSKSDKDAGGSATDPADQPRIALLDGAESLGTALGASGDAPPPDLVFTEVVAGTAHVCARDTGGGVWCWGDPMPRAWYPPAPSRVRGAPPLINLRLPLSFDRGGGNVQTFDGATCGQAADERWWCWGNHPSNPAQDRRDRDDLMTAVLAPDGIGSLLPPNAAPPAAVVNRWNTSAGFAIVNVDADPVQRRAATCGLTTAGELQCWPGLRDGEDATPMGTLPVGTRLAGACALTPDGHVRCHLPLTEGQPCPLGLTTIQATGTRGCGRREDGSFRCFGRPVGISGITVGNLRDVQMPGCQ